MAVRFDASADYLQRASPPSGDITVAFWGYLSVDKNFWGFWLHFGPGLGNDSRLFGTKSDGTTVFLDSGDTNDSGSTLSVNTWYHFAFSDSDDNDRQRGYVDGVLDVNTAQTTARTTSQCRFGQGGPGDYINGRMAAVKVWNAELTADEIKREMYTITPQRISNLWAWYPLFPGSSERLIDYSGNNRDLTAGGTLTSESGPPAVWMPWMANVEVGAAAAGMSIPVVQHHRQQQGVIQ